MRHTKEHVADWLASLVMQGSEAEKELSWLYRTFYSEEDIARDLEDKGVNIRAEDYVLAEKSTEKSANDPKIEDMRAISAQIEAELVRLGEKLPRETATAVLEMTQKEIHHREFMRSRNRLEGLTSEVMLALQAK